MSGQIYPPPPGSPDFLEVFAATTKKFYEEYIKREKLDANVVFLASGLSALVEHLRLEQVGNKGKK